MFLIFDDFESSETLGTNIKTNVRACNATSVLYATQELGLVKF